MARNVWGAAWGRAVALYGVSPGGWPDRFGSGRPGGWSLRPVRIQKRFSDLSVLHRRLSGAVVFPPAEALVPSL